MGSWVHALMYPSSHQDRSRVDHPRKSLCAPKLWGFSSITSPACLWPSDDFLWHLGKNPDPLPRFTPYPHLLSSPQPSPDSLALSRPRESPLPLNQSCPRCSAGYSWFHSKQRSLCTEPLPNLLSNSPLPPSAVLLSRTVILNWRWCWPRPRG